MKTNYLIFLFLILNSCSTTQKQPSVDQPDPVASPTHTASNGEVKVPSIIYDPIISFDSEKSFIKEGQDQANAVLASDCFKSEIATSTFNENLGLTNAQIYKKFVDASPFKVGIQMFTGGFYERINRTVAYEGNPIKMNRKYVWTATYVGSTSLHEGFGHGLDFRHDKSIAWDSKNIPYTLNRIFEKCAKALGYKIVY